MDTYLNALNASRPAGEAHQRDGPRLRDPDSVLRATSGLRLERAHTSVAQVIGDAWLSLSNPFVDPTHPNAQATEETAATLLTGSSEAGAGPLEALHKRAAPNAILNAGGRADEVRCHPGTRAEVLGRIEKWRDAQDGLAPPIFWLSGPAGAGKTAIVQTIAERCNAEGVPQANFFFFRTDASRNSLSPLIATLVHQVILLYPTLRDPLATVLSTNPLILDAMLEDQLKRLIIEPLQAIRQLSSSYRPPLLLINGLDECGSEDKGSQRQIVHAFDKILAKHPSLFCLLVASRDESQIRAAFNNISSPLIPVYLDDQYSPERDIRTFLHDEFKRVRRTHPLAHTLDAAWPSAKNVEGIVKKSSGQFIYAATVMRFILDSLASPMLSLAWVQGAAQISTKSPFAYLDAIYTYILSQADDQGAVRDILHAQLLIQDAAQSSYGRAIHAPEAEVVPLLRGYNPKYTNAMIHSCLADLTPIAQYVAEQNEWLQAQYKLRFHHASFVDYLLDQSRSKDYFVDFDAFSFNIQPVVWNGLESSQKRPGLGLDTIAYSGLFRLHQLPPAFLHILIAQTPSHFDMMAVYGKVEVADIFRHIYNLCTTDYDVTNYKWILRGWINTQQHKSGTDFKWPPCSRKYLAMAHIDGHVTTEPRGNIGIALRPETNSDTTETAVWLDSLLHRIHIQKYRSSIQEYNRLLQQWTSWATWNNVPLDRVDDLPKAQWYLRRSRIEKWLASCLKLGSRK
ncbi:hypothetical protein D9619_012426 [Psilocybe cf. subviscida]|uniref:NACHT domain-containing protein n=1 Tax=Psilocybe cf. subviscida TaxID=2480587 RepID=A0A8H5ARS9_9AGAR|nr:hypothetical protein D9619_012426 [Psilocybe cf. subviscida]